ncbi:MAG: hypothetical protein HYZ20_01830 [Burkholderiales bacterium]|nr:hypothetical protein [Burkholderiales bacterium]
MKTRQLVALIALSFAAAAHADPVMDSFDRMLTHAAATMATARPAESADPLVATMVEPLREAHRAGAVHVAATGDDAVRASFDRMLQHEPTPLAARVPAGSDPLVAALIEPLRDDDRAGAVHVAAVSDDRIAASLDRMLQHESTPHAAQRRPLPPHGSRH